MTEGRSRRRGRAAAEPVPCRSGLPRFFLTRDGPVGVFARGLEIRLDGAVGHQIARVLRLRAGERVILQDGLGAAWELVLDRVDPGTVSGTVDRRCAVAPDPAIAVTLHAAVLKGERQDWLIQKAVELGVARIQPLICARSVARPGADRAERWRRIAREAAEQCERGTIPPVADPVGLDAAAWEGAAIACIERGGRPLAETLGRSAALALFVGPEGGWEPSEVAWLLEHGAAPASLGPRILRADTAALAALAAILALGEA